MPPTFDGLLSTVLGRVFEAEAKLAGAPGASKLDHVLEGVFDMAGRNAERLGSGGIEFVDLTAAVKDLVAAVVRVLNALGVFQRGNPAAPKTPPEGS